jgi:hypothetical protein
MWARLFPKHPHQLILLILPLLLLINAWYGTSSITIELSDGSFLNLNLLNLMLPLLVIVVGIAVTYWLAQRMKTPLITVLNYIHVILTLVSLSLLIISLHQEELAKNKIAQTLWLRSTIGSLIVLQLAQLLFLINVIYGFFFKYWPRMRRRA